MTSQAPSLQTARPQGAAAAVVHIGNLKTGSTAVQLVLRSLRSELAARGVIMPGLGKNLTAHYGIRHDIEAGGEQPFLTLMRQEIAAAPAGSRFLITAEPLIHVPPQTLARVLSEIGCHDVSLLCYLRPSVAMLGALYLQSAKMGHRRGPISAHLDMLSEPPVQFMAAMARFAEVFGKDRMTLREYHPKALADGSVVADFWDMAGLPADLRARAIALETRANPSPTAEVTAVMRACAMALYAGASEAERAEVEGAPYVFSTMAQSMRLIWAEVAAKAARIGGSRFRLPIYIQEAMNARFETERAAFARQWFQVPATDDWLHEPVVAPQPLSDIAAAPVVEALGTALPKLIQADKPTMAASLETFIAGLPITGAHLSLAALESRLAPEAPPVDLTPFLHP
ncbi:hypothetical protein [Stagnihabitans tardus]|uniref:Uncharacterized protein n=1 Tax=Stagnihabitans tardus TaxID=2699202 RepID=A0AAE4Y865_9RHOB|nr:hypothetical protein [Stagnihabitans tardus]NBZ87643.1 hypothetical protein [Stagnihabitans tardus]